MINIDYNKIESKPKFHLVNLVFPILFFSIGLSTLVSGRDASLYGTSTDDMYIASSIGIQILQIGTFLTVLISCLLFLTFIFKANGKIIIPKIFKVFIVFFIAVKVFPGLFGFIPSLVYQSFYPLIVGGALIIFSQQSGYLKFLKHARNALLIYILASYIAFFFFPSVTMQQGYEGFISSLPFRFWGLASHANNLGANAALLILMVITIPYNRFVINLLIISILIFTLILTQSKTSLIAVLIALIVDRIIVFVKRNPSKQKIIILFLSFLIVVLGILFALAFLQTYHVDTDLTGRDVIWAISIDSWSKNIWFGYGNEIWNEDFANRYQLFKIASNCHNQIIQVLAMSGLAGLTGFILFNISIVKEIQRQKDLNLFRLGAAIFIFFIIRGISEVPLGIENIMTSDFLMTSIFLISISGVSTKYKLRGREF